MKTSAQSDEVLDHRELEVVDDYHMSQINLLLKIRSTPKLNVKREERSPRRDEKRVLYDRAAILDCVNLRINTSPF